MFLVNGIKQQKIILNYGTKDDILSKSGNYIGEIYWVTDIASDPNGALAVWDGTQWVGFLRSEKLESL